MEKINKAYARRLYNNGKTVTVIAHKNARYISAESELK